MRIHRLSRILFTRRTQNILQFDTTFKARKSTLPDFIMRYRYFGIACLTASSLVSASYFFYMNQVEMDVDAILRLNEGVYLERFGKHILRLDHNQVKSNDPIEDRFFVSYNEHHNILYFGVLDGHGGFHCADYLSKNLVSHINAKIKKDLIDGFENLDNMILYENIKKHPTLDNILNALTGSCALMCVYSLNDNKMTFALTGDSRAIIGRMNKANNNNSVATSNFEAHRITNDQTLDNQSEHDRIMKEHPNESGTVIRSKRILGSLQPTRAFGDAKYKWSSQIQEKIYNDLKDDLSFYIHPKRLRVSKYFYTPPYVTASPVVTEYSINKDDVFCVISTDGLYDELQDQEIVDLVAQKIAQTTQNLTTKDWINKDTNYSTHLIRNALGGSNTKKLKKLLINIPAPKCRNYRDDMTVLVLLFMNNYPIPQNEIINNDNSSKSVIPSKFNRV